MQEKIKLTHPEGKKGVSIDKIKYDIIKNALLKSLDNTAGITHKEMLAAITNDLKENNIVFEGSIEWYMEWIKLDLESHKEIYRLKDQSPVKFRK